MIFHGTVSVKHTHRHTFQRHITTNIFTIQIGSNLDGLQKPFIHYLLTQPLMHLLYNSF